MTRTKKKKHEEGAKKGGKSLAQREKENHKTIGSIMIANWGGAQGRKRKCKKRISV